MDPSASRCAYIAELESSAPSNAGDVHEPLQKTSLSLTGCPAIFAKSRLTLVPMHLFDRQDFPAIRAPEAQPLAASIPKDTIRREAKA